MPFSRFLFHQDPQPQRRRGGAQVLGDETPKAAAATNISSTLPPNVTGVLRPKDVNKLVDKRVTSLALPALILKAKLYSPTQRPIRTPNILSAKPAGIIKSAQKPQRMAAVGRSPTRLGMNHSHKASPEKKRSKNHLRDKIGKQRSPRKSSPHKVKASKKVPEPEHPLFLVFKETSAAYQDQAIRDLNDHLETVIKQISDALSQTSIQSQYLISASVAANKCLKLPLQDEGLLISERAKDGSGERTKIRATIGRRVEAYEEVVARDTGRLRELWGQWDEVMKKIGGLLIPEEQGKGGKDGIGAAEDGREGDGGNFHAKYRKLDEEYAKKRDEILGRFTADADGLVEEVRERELKFEKQRKEQQRQFIEFMKRQMEEDEDE